MVWTRRLGRLTTLGFKLGADMRKRIIRRYDYWRAVHPALGGSPSGANWGYFEYGPLRIMSSGSGDRWEHVSVSCANRCPTWAEMCMVKDVFWDDEETVIQFHPPKSVYVNCHPYCLHLWKDTEKAVALPPKETIA